MGTWALVVAVVLGLGSAAWSALAWYGARNEARDARRAAERAAEAAEAAVAAAERGPRAVERPVEPAPEPPADPPRDPPADEQADDPVEVGPPTWRIQEAGGNAGWLLRNEGSQRALDVTLTAEDDEHVTLRVPPVWPYVDRHAAVAFSALPAAGAKNRNVVVEWRWEADGPVRRWVTALPRRT